MPNVIITGASSGIGLEVTRLLAKRRWSLVLAARNIDALEEAAVMARDAGAEAVLIQPTDMGAPDEVNRLINAAHQALGSIDVLINNAGYAPLCDIAETDDATLRDSFNVNAIGPGIAITRVFAIMKEQPGGGRIVNISSIATQDPFPGFFAYAAAKCALNSYARSIANEGQEHGILGFAVAPGAVETPMLRTHFGTDMIPAEACLSPTTVAEVIVQCALGEHDAENGSTIWIPSG